jgi:hypothetical protein
VSGSGYLRSPGRQRWTPTTPDLLELAFEAVCPIWEAVDAVDADRRLTALGAWGLPRALVRAWGSDLDAT